MKMIDSKNTRNDHHHAMYFAFRDLIEAGVPVREIVTAKRDSDLSCLISALHDYHLIEGQKLGKAEWGSFKVREDAA
jgi:hypothetical protein